MFLRFPAQNGSGSGIVATGAKNEKLSLADLAGKVGRVLEKNDQFGFVVFETNGIIKLLYDKSTARQDFNGTRNKFDIAISSVLEKYRDPGKQIIDGLDSLNALGNQQQAVALAKDYLKEMASSNTGTDLTSDQAEDRANAYIKALDDPDTDKGALLEEITQEIRKYLVRDDLGKTGSMFTSSATTGGATQGGLEMIGLAPKMDTPQFSFSTFAQQFRTVMANSGIPVSKNKEEMERRDNAFLKTLPENAELISQTEIFFHENGHYALPGHKLDERGADFYGAIKTLQTFPGQDAREVLQYKADMRMLEGLTFIKPHGIIEVPTHAEAYGFGAAFAIQQALKLSPDQISRMSDREIIKRGESLDTVGEGKTAQYQYDTLKEVKYEAERIAREAGKKPDIGAYRQAAENLLAKDHVSENGQPADDKAAMRTLTLKTVQGALERLEERTLKIKNNLSAGPSQDSGVRSYYNSTPDQEISNAAPASSVRNTETIAAEQKFSSSLAAAEHHSGLAAEQADALRVNHGITHAAETLAALKTQGLTPDARADMYTDLKRVMDDPAIKPALVTLTGNLDLAEREWNTAIRDASGDPAAIDAVRKSFKGNYQDKFGKADIPLDDGAGNITTLGARTDAFASGALEKMDRTTAGYPALQARTLKNNPELDFS